ncbi:hypothetical protein J6590_004136 [Homalodisca vitripennis]|nr:hypothetical protein J6590_004136 [Homalodisca vitripennis]
MSCFRCSITCSRSPTTKQNKVILLMLGPGHDISALVTPGAPLSHVVHDIEGMTECITEDDIVVIVGCTNDIGDDGQTELGETL